MKTLPGTHEEQVQVGPATEVVHIQKEKNCIYEITDHHPGLPIGWSLDSILNHLGLRLYYSTDFLLNAQYK